MHCKLSITFSDAKLLLETLPKVLQQECWQTKTQQLWLNESQIKAHFKPCTSILSHVSGYQAKQLFLNEKEVGTSFIEALFSRLERNQQKLEEERDAENVDQEGWGTTLLTSLSRYLPTNKSTFHERLHWFQLGTFENAFVWRIDKPQIAAILKHEADEKFLFLCPGFQFESVEAIIDRLPDSIDIRKNSNWRILEADRLEGSKIRRRPVGIVHKITAAQSTSHKNAEAEKEERTRNIPKVSFTEIGGIHPILATIREVVELPLKKPELFEHLAIKPHRGILLYGPPGCGKTLIAKAIAHEVQAHFISVKGPEILNKYYGESEGNLRKMFEEAREMQPSIIFFDEIDAIAQKRSGLETLRMDDRLVNQLLSLMDGIEDYGRITVLAATNRPELIDQALMRPGRFDYRIEIPKPDLQGCHEILKINTNKMPLSADVDLNHIAEKMHGHSGAELAFLARESAYNCMRRSLQMDDKDFDVERMKQIQIKDLRIEAQDFERALTDFLSHENHEEKKTGDKT